MPTLLPLLLPLLPLLVPVYALAGMMVLRWMELAARHGWMMFGAEGCRSGCMVGAPAAAARSLLHLRVPER